MSAQLIEEYISHRQPIIQYGVLAYRTANKTLLQKLGLSKIKSCENFISKRRYES